MSAVETGTTLLSVVAQLMMLICTYGIITG